MNKLLILALLSICLNAGQSDNNKPKSDEELLKEFQELSKQGKTADMKIKQNKAEIDSAKNLGKTLDEIGNKLGVDKK